MVQIPVLGDLVADDLAKVPVLRASAHRSTQAADAINVLDPAIGRMEVSAFLDEDGPVSDLARLATDDGLLAIRQIWSARTHEARTRPSSRSVGPPAGNSVLVQRAVIDDVHAVGVFTLQSHHCLRHLASFDRGCSSLAGPHPGARILLLQLIVLLVREVGIVVGWRDSSHAIVLCAQYGGRIADLVKVRRHLQLTFRVVDTSSSPAVLELRSVAVMANGSLRTGVLER